MKRVMLALAAFAAVPAAAEEDPASHAGAVALLGPALNVGNLDAELRFYVDGLGMTKMMQMGKPERTETMLGYPGVTGQPGLILMSDSTHPKQKPLAMGKAFDRLVMRVRNLPAVVERLRKMGYKATDVRNVAKGYRMAIATDPEGFRLELVESGMK